VNSQWCLLIKCLLLFLQIAHNPEPAEGAHCLLPINYYSLLIANCLIAHCPLHLILSLPKDPTSHQS
jgi:hypothetical protein